MKIKIVGHSGRIINPSIQRGFLIFYASEKDWNEEKESQVELPKWLKNFISSYGEAQRQIGRDEVKKEIRLLIGAGGR
jgi:hypothetical protein